VLFCHVHAMALPKDRKVATVERIVMTYEKEWVATAARIATLKDAAQIPRRPPPAPTAPTES